MASRPNPQATTGGGDQVLGINELVREMVFGPNPAEISRRIRQLAQDNGIFPASIHSFYEKIGEGSYRGFSVPAMNLRGITYHCARAAFRAALQNQVGALIFEIARSEMEYTRQTPVEYSGCILAAALAENYRGPVFIQGDHIQMRRKSYFADAASELAIIKGLVNSLVQAGFYNIDIDASTLVDIDKPSLEEQQQENSQVTAVMTGFIRGIEPVGVTISIGGEIGEIGKGNSTAAELRAFMNVYRSFLPPSTKGISKVSVQTGTTHGGIPLPDGTMASIELDFNTLGELSRIARDEFGLGGVVQHGASTLPDDMFQLFPEVGTLEVHLATGFQNVILDSAHFPSALRQRIYAGLASKYASDRQPNDTDAQFYYRNRKRAFGDFKQEFWDLPPENLARISRELEERFGLLFRKLNVVGTRDMVNQIVTGS